MPGINRSESTTTNLAPELVAPADRFSARRTLRNQRSGASISSLRSLRQYSTNGSGVARPSPSPRARSMSIENRKAVLPIDFIIVGAGIAGLAAAFALAHSGHRVRVLERLEGVHKHSVGVRVPPNLSKILYAWGLREELSTSSRCLKSTFLSLDTNECLGVLEWKEDVISETGGDFILMHYDDLYDMLYKLAVSEGVKIQFGAEVKTTYFDEAQGLPVVTLIDGTKYTADLVIGADGYNSIVREVVTGSPDPGVDSGMSIFSMTVPGEKIQNDPEWGRWLRSSEWPMWLGSGRNILAYPIRNGKELSIHAYHPDNLIATPDKSETWTKVAPTSILSHDDTDPSISRIFSMANEGVRVKYQIRQVVDDWVDESGTILLIGEAAHPLLPCTIHNLALAVEDAAVLGVLMSHLKSRPQIPQLLEAFQDLRYSRIEKVHQSELGLAALTILPPGEQRDMRNAGLRQTLLASQSTEKWDDEQLREQWEEVSDVFGYNALEAAEDWWLQWGSLADAARNYVQPKSLDLFLEISKVAIPV